MTVYHLKSKSQHVRRLCLSKKQFKKQNKKKQEYMSIVRMCFVKTAWAKVVSPWVIKRKLFCANKSCFRWNQHFKIHKNGKKENFWSCYWYFCKYETSPLYSTATDTVFGVVDVKLCNALIDIPR
jgi:hypothetical protein